MADAVAKEPIPIQPGSGLSMRTPVVKPTPIPNVQAWTIETVRPRGYLYSVAPSPDGKLLAVGGLDGTVRLFDLKTGTFVKALVGHQYYVYGLAWSPDSSALASSGSFDGTVRIWDVEKGQPLRAIAHPAYTAALTWSPKGDQLFITGGTSGVALLWDVTKATKKEVAKVEFGAAVTTAVWSPDGKTIAVGVTGRTVSLVSAGDFTKTVAAGEAGDGIGLAWLPNSEAVAITSPKASRLSFTDATKPAQAIPTRSFGIAVSPDGKTIATLGNGIELWDATKGTALRKFNATGNWLHWSGDGSALIATSYGAVNVYEAADGKKRFTIDLLGTAPHATWSSAGRMLLAGQGSNRLTCIDPLTGKTVATLTDDKAIWSSAAVAPGGKQIAVGATDGSVRVYEIAGEKLLHKLTAHTSAVNAIAWSENAAYFATGSADKSVRIWNVAKGMEERAFNDHSAAVNAVAWGPSLASGGKGPTFVLSSLMMGKPARTLDTGNEILAIAWSADKKSLAIGTEQGEVLLVNPTKPSVTQTLEHLGSPKSVTALAFAPQGPMLASGRGNHTLQLWNTQTGKVVHDVRVAGVVHSVAWTADGKAVTTGTNDRCVRSWDPATGQLIGTVIVSPGHGTTVISDEGFYRAGKEDENIVFVVQTGAGQVTLSPEEFATKYKWKNQPTRARFPGP